MNKRNIESFLDFKRNSNGFVCDVDGKRDSYIESFLRIVNHNYNNVNCVDFFEFGSAEYNISMDGPRSGISSHFMGLATGFNYKCFDAYIEKNDFDVIADLMNNFVEIKNNDFEKNNFSSTNWKKSLAEYSGLSPEKDLSDIIVKAPFMDCCSDFFGLYENVNLEDLRHKISKFSIDDYSNIVELIKDSKKPVLLSNNVLNAPNLSRDFSFWKLDEGFHVHSGDIVEFARELGVGLDVDYYYSKGKEFNQKDLFLKRFKKRFGLREDLKVELSNRCNDGRHCYFYWNTEK